jgi:hypothetical protein
MRIVSICFLTLGIAISVIVMACHKQDATLDAKPRFIVVLMDETNSFQIDTTQFWPEIRSWTIEIVKQLEPGEGFGVIGIDDHGFDADDIRISPIVLDENVLVSTRQKRALVEQLQGLNKRHLLHNYTDIVGALYQTAELVREQQDHQIMIIIFSDMIQTPSFPKISDVANLSFPTDSRVCCFYVNATRENNKLVGHEEWEKIVNAWIPIFNVVGLHYQNEQGDPQFYERGATKIALEKIF